jgi:cyanophycinase
MNRLRSLGWSVLLLAAAPLALAEQPAYRYLRSGEPNNITVQPRPGFALMGGGTDIDEAFQFLCERASGGDFLVLRATGDDDYNPYIRGLCHLNSVATLIIPNRQAAADPFVAGAIHHAGAIFIAGGDQANYIRYWMNTPVQSALNDAIRHGVPIGGTSAGLAVLGEYVYSALADKSDDPNLDGKTAMADPYGPRIDLVHGFVDIPILKGLITDTHFARRDRMGRLLVFLARINEPDGKPLPSSTPRIRAIGVDERSAVLLEPDGRARVVGNRPAYFIDCAKAEGTLQAGKPFSFGPFEIQKVAPGGNFYLRSWAGDAITYKLSVENGRIRSTQNANEIY